MSNSFNIKQKHYLGAAFGGWLLVIVLTVCHLIDIYVAYERLHSVKSLGDFACAAHPYLSLAHPFFSSALLNVTSAQCQANGAAEPAISIIFFMIKLNISYVALCGYAITIICFRKTFLDIREHFHSKAKMSNTLFEALKSEVFTFISTCLIMVLMLLDVSLITDPGKYPLGRFVVKGSENVAIMMLLIAYMTLLRAFVALIEHTIGKTKYTK